MLEEAGIESFTLKVEGDDFLIRGRKRVETSPPAAPETGLRVIWRLLRRTESEPKASITPSPVVELRYTLEDIAHLESAAKAKRTGSGASPEPHALSQILRAVGAFIDQKEGQLLAVSKEEQNITIEYRTLDKDVRQEFTIAGLYDYWVKMYLKRRVRAD